MQRFNGNFAVRRRARRAVALVEAAIVLPWVLVGVLALLDLGLAVTRANHLSDCARRAARLAIVHGDAAETPWGPDAWTGTLDQQHPLADQMRPWLFGVSPEDVQMQLTWADGGNLAGERVSIALAFQHASVLATLFGHWTLTAQSTMRIVH